MSLVDGELLAYESATLTGANAYSLTGLQRGIGNAGPARASRSAPAFARLDSAVVQYALPANWIGVPLYFKFQSFNVFGAGVQDLSTCVVYTYTPTGASAIGAATQAFAVGTSLDWGSRHRARRSKPTIGGRASRRRRSLRSISAAFPTDARSRRFPQLQILFKGLSCPSKSNIAATLRRILRVSRPPRAN